MAIDRIDMTDRVAAAGGGAAVWGGITGVLSSQTDLQTALNGKENTGVAAAGDAAHLAAGDPHPQYLTVAEGNAAYSALAHTHPQSDVTGLVAALAGKANAAHSHIAADVSDFSEAVDDRVAALLVAGANVTLTYNDAGNQLTIAATGGGGGSATINSAVVTLPGADGVMQWRQFLADAAVTPASKIMLTLGAFTDADENDAEMLDILSMAAYPGTGQFEVVMSFAAMTSGPINLNYLRA